MDSAELAAINKKNREESFRMSAAQGEAMTLGQLMAAGVSVDCADSAGETALMKACMNGHVDAVRTLVKAGADKDAVSHIGHTPLGFAISHGREEAAVALI